MQANRQRILKILFLLGTVLAALKMIFVDYSMDEEYQIVMAYRNLSGEALFTTMWEPHQTSAFLCVFFMWIFHSIFGTYTGVVLFIRVLTTGIQIGLSVWVYKVLQRLLQPEYAFWIALLYFNIVPKLIEIPEFANMQYWFWTIMVLALMEYETNPKYEGRLFYILLAGIALSLEVLAYPASVIIFPFAIGWFLGHSNRYGWRAVWAFTLTCAACGGIWLALVLSRVPFEEFIRNLGYVVSFDLTHELQIAATSKWVTLLQGMLEGIGLLLLCVLGGLLGRRMLPEEKKSSFAFSVCLVLSALAIQLFYWVILNKGYEKPQIHLLTAMIVGVLAWREADERKKQFAFGLWSAVLTLCAVFYMSDLDFFSGIPHSALGALWGICVLVLSIPEEEKERRTVFGRVLIYSFLAVAILGKGYTLRGGRDGNVTGVRGIMQNGPASGALCDYMCAYIYNSNYEDFRSNISVGENVLIVTNMIESAGTTPYMFVDANICHFSIVDPTSYDERLQKYWELYPEKMPDTIVVDCWYGQLMESTESWIMQYIEKEFGYSEVVDGKYVRFYKK